MSHPIYLTSSALARMPQGSRNEWHQFFDSSEELEANGFFPLFWLALFHYEDIQHARFVDENDVDDADSAIERQEAMDSFGADATYPYLVTGRREALERLSARRNSVIAAIGERYRPIFDGFEALVTEGFVHDYVLLRTSGLPDAADIEQWLRAQLGQLDQLADPAVIEQLTADLSGYGADPIWRLSGSGSSGIWPTPTVSSQYRTLPPPRQVKTFAKAARPHHTSAVSGPLDNALEWVAAIVAAGGALGAYAITRSIFLAVLVFVVLAVAAGFALVRFARSRKS